MTTPFKLGNVVVCEYIVEGANNKHTLINTYTGDILVKEFPASIAVAFYIEFIPVQDYHGELEITLLVGKKVAMKGAAELDFTAGRPSVMAIPMGLITLSKAEKFRLLIGVKDARPLKAVEKSVSLADGVSHPIA